MCIKTLRSFIVLLFVLSLSGGECLARVISYAPVTDLHARPAIQRRGAPGFLLLETRYSFGPPQVAISAGSPSPPAADGILVLYDASGDREPLVVLEPPEGGHLVGVAAMTYSDEGVARILVSSGPYGTGNMKLRYSPDTGKTWTELPLDSTYLVSEYFRPDVGGRVVRGRGSQVRLGSNETPFVFAAQRYESYQLQETKIFAVDSDGSIRTLLELEPSSNAMLIGSDIAGERFLVIGRPVGKSNGIRILHNDGTLEDVLITDDVHYWMEGWITDDDSVVVESQKPGLQQKVVVVRNGSEQVLAALPPGQGTGPVLYAVPDASYEGAWIVSRVSGQPTKLLRFDGQTVAEQWSDSTSPEVEAVHVGAGGDKLLIQVHRPRAADGRIIVDPALAIWNVGAPAPIRYDELFLAEGMAKTFVSLDVDVVAAGGAFVFDSARTEAPPPPPVSGGAGGGEITQEWGVVRASLQQRLLLPALARLPGAYGSFWKTDMILRNDDNRSLTLHARFASSEDGSTLETDLVLEPNEIRLVGDALRELFGIENGGGALYLTPENGRVVDISSRTYAEATEGTYGMGVPAWDLNAASSARFVLTYAGAFQGPDTRTNILVADAGTRGAMFSLKASGPTGAVGSGIEGLHAPEAGQVQVNHLMFHFGLPGHRGALTFETDSGRTIPLVVSIDNRTNDPTVFPPDVAASTRRTIPIIGHVDGANNARFRTDLFLFNPEDQLRSVYLTCKPLDSASFKSVQFTLLPGEAKVIPDVYKTVFDWEGVGRLQYESISPWESGGVRVTARIYTERDDGGTYGYVMPPLNAFQAAGPGESVEILGAVIDSRFRTNLAIVDTAGQSNGQTQRVRVEIFGTGGLLLDSFDTNVLNAGGVQLTDLFNARGLSSDEPMPVVIRVSPAAGVFGAFATMIDNRTNDPMYLGAGLAAQ